MERTVIKIPGKRTLDQSKVGIAARKLLNRPAGRPLLLRTKQDFAAKTVVPPVVKKRKKRSLKNIKSKRKMSALEKLPVELLELVFAFCLNVDLPRASPVIGGKLSSETVYMRTLFEAFGSHWSRTLTGGEEELPAYADLQSSILCCRWSKVDLLLKAQDLWMRKKSLLITNPVYFIPKIQESEDEREDSVDVIDTDDSDTEGKIFEPRANPPKITAISHFEQDFTEFTEFVTSRPGTQPVAPTWEAQLSLAEGVEIPHSILFGHSWDEATIRYLFWIVKGGARLNWTTTTSGEIALLGQKKAISAGNLRAIYLLQWAGLHEKIDVELLIWALRNAGGDKLAVLELLISLGHLIFDVLTTVDANKFHNAVYIEQDKRTLDKEQHIFLEKLQQSSIVQAWG